MSDTSGVDPTAMMADKLGVDPELLKSMAGSANAQYQSSYSDLISALGMANQAGQQTQQGIQQDSAAQQQINNIQGAATAKKISDDRGAAAAFGTNPDAASYVMATLGDRVLKEQQDIANRRDMITQKADLNFADNPLQWVVNQFTMPMDIEAANVKISAMNGDMDTIHQLEAATQEQMVTNAAIDQADTAKLVSQQNIQVAAKAIRDVAASQMQVAQLGMQGVSLKDAVTRDQLNSVFQLNQNLGDRERLLIASTELPATMAELQARTESYAAMADARAQTMEDKRTINQQLMKAGTMLSMTAPTADQFRTLPAKTKAFWEQAMSDADFGKLPGGMIGPASAVQSANDINAPLTPGMNDTRVKIGKMIDTAEANASFRALAKPEDREAFKNGAVKSQINTEMQNIPTTTSVYSPLSIRAVVLSTPALGNNPIAQELAIPASMPDVAMNQDLVFKTAMKLVGNKQLTPAQAGQATAEVYKAMQVQLNQTHQYSRFGVQPLDATTGYKQSVFMGSGFAKSGVVDMSNGAAVTNALTRAILDYQSQLSAAAMGGSAMGAPFQPNTKVMNAIDGAVPQ